MSSYVTRAGKGSALTHSELDDRAIIVAQTKAGAYTVVESDNRDTIEVSATATITIPDAATIAGLSDTGDYQVTIKNLSGTTTIARTTGADTIDGTAADITLIELRSVTLKVNQAGDGYNIIDDTFSGGAAITSTTAELNILDGVTSTTAELNLLDGALVTTAEINNIDGDTAATATTVATGDRVVYNDNGTMVQVDVDDVDTYFSQTTKTLTNKTLTTPIITNGTATTQAKTDDSTKIATTAYVKDQLEIDTVQSLGTSTANFTVPSGTKKITMTIVSTGGGRENHLTMETSVGEITSGYVGGGMVIDNDNTQTATTFSSEFKLSSTSASVTYLEATLTLHDPATHTWSCKSIAFNNDTSDAMFTSIGFVTCTNEAIQLNIANIGGTVNVNCLYEL